MFKIVAVFLALIFH